MTVPIASFIALMLAFQVKHYLADFVLQTNWMAHGKDSTMGWQLPLTAHAGLHGLGTLCIAAVAALRLWWLALLDIAVHGLIDRGKALVVQQLKVPVTDARFWWVIGFDQMLHQITNVILVGGLLAA